MENRQAAEISALLSVGFLVDRLLVALDQYGAGDLAQREQVLLEDLRLFLAGVRERLEHPSALLSGESSTFAFPPARHFSLDLMPVVSETRGAGGESRREDVLVEYIQNLQETTNALLKPTEVDTEHLDKLRRFLQAVGSASLAEVHNRRMKGEAGAPPARIPT